MVSSAPPERYQVRQVQAEEMKTHRTSNRLKGSFPFIKLTLVSNLDYFERYLGLGPIRSPLLSGASKATVRTSHEDNLDGGIPREASARFDAGRSTSFGTDAVVAANMSTLFASVIAARVEEKKNVNKVTTPSLKTILLMK